MKILIDRASLLLLDNKVVAIPTDTIYGLAVACDKKEAICALYELKKRPSSNPLVLFVKEAKDVDQFVSEIPTGGKALMEAFWPGPLTLVLPSKRSSTIAIRIPNHPLIISLLEKTGPLFVTSANISGNPPLKSTSEIETTFGTNFPVLDGELPQVGLASTILSFENNLWQIDRHGPISPEDFFPILGYVPKNKLTITPVSD